MTQVCTTVRRGAPAVLVVAFGVVLGAGCGGAAPDMEVRFAWPAALTGSCAASPAEFNDKLEAGLRIGGHAECPLTVNETDRTANGTCEHVTVGIPRPVALVWYLQPPPTADRAQLMYFLSVVDLRKSSLSATTTSVDVELINDGTSGVAWYHPDQLSAIPATEPSDKTTFDYAMYWAGKEMGPEHSNDVQPYLDRDDDGCPNLVEACDGNLYTDGNNEMACGANTDQIACSASTSPACTWSTTAGRCIFCSAPDPPN